MRSESKSDETEKVKQQKVEKERKGGKRVVIRGKEIKKEED